MMAMALHESEKWGDGFGGDAIGGGWGGRENSFGDGAFCGSTDGDGFGGAVDGFADIEENEEQT